MAKTIEELNFQLKVDDKAFKAQMEADKKAAKDLSNTIREYLNIKKAQGTLSAKEYQTLKRLENLESNRRINAEKELAAQAKRIAAEERLAKVKEKNNQHQSTHNRLMSEAASLATSYLSIWGAKKLIENIVQTTGEFELQRTTLAAMLRDAEKATHIFERLKTFSVLSPFSFKELATYAKQLTAYSVPINDLFNTTKMLADVSAGLGVGMDRIVLAYGQVRSAEFLRGQEVRQFTESGIPILEELRKQFEALGEEGITVADVFDKISKRLVPFEMVDKVFKDLTSEGGKFYKMQEVQSETLKGKISNLKDAYMIMFNEIGSRQSGLLKGGVDALRGLAENYEKIGRLLVGLISAYGTYRTAMLITEVATKSFTLANHKLINSFVSLGKFLKTNPYVALATAVAALVGYFISAGVQASRFRKELEGIANVKFNEAEKAVKTFKELANQLKNSTEGSQAYRDAIADLNRQYGDYLPNLLNEKNALTEILKVENEVTNAIYARAKAYATEEGRRKIEERYGGNIQDYGSYVTSVVSVKYGESAAQDFIKGYRKRLEEDIHSDWFLMLQESLNSYFGEGASGEVINTERFITARRHIEEYAKAVRDLTQANADFDRKIDARFGTQGYSSDLERKISEPIVKAYNDALKKLRDKELSVEEFNKAANNLKLKELYELKEVFEDLDMKARAVGKEGSWANKIKEIQEQINALQPKDLGWLQKLVNPLVTGRGNNDLKARVDTKYEEYIDNLRKEYKAVTESYADSDKTFKKLTADKQKGLLTDDAILKKAAEQNEFYEQRKKVIEDIAKALGVSVNDKVKKGGKGTKSPEQKELETRIDLLKKLQSAYERLSEYVSDEEMPDLLSKFFSSSKVENKDAIIKDLNYRKQLIDAAVEMEKYDKEAAERLRSYIGYDESTEKVKEFIAQTKKEKEALKAQKALVDYLKSWNIGDETSGTGAIYKVTKVVSDYQKALDALGDKRGDATEKLDEWIKAEKAAGRTVSDEAKAAKENEIANKYAVASTNLLNKAMNDLQNTAEGLVKEWLAISGIDISNWSNKSTAELKALRKEIENLTDEEVINRLGGSWEQLVSKLGNEKAAEYLGFIREAINSISGDVDETLDDKNLKNLKYAATQLSKLAKELGDVGEAVSDISDVVSSVAQGAKQGGWVGALVSGIVTVGAKLLQEVTYAKELQKVLYETQISARTARWDGILGSSESIFGDSTLTKMRAISQVLSETRASLDGIMADLSEQRIKEAWHNSYLNPLGKIEDTVETIVAKLQGGVSTNLLAQEDKAWKAYREAIEKGYSGLETYIVKTIDRSLFVNFAGIQDQYKSLKDLFDEVGYSMYDQYGNLNAEGLQAILDTYDKLGEADRKWINDAIAASEEYQKAIESLDDVLEGYFGNIASELVDSMLESFKQTGDAAADLESVFANLGDTIAKAFGQSLLIDVLKEKYYDFIKKASLDYANTGDYQAYLNDITEFKTGLENDLPLLTDAIQGIFETVRDTVGMSDSASQNLADGIKGIPEDTANLLASYLNGIRADVSMSKAQRDNILAEIKNIASYVASPTLMDYLNRIQANTFDTANNTRDMLSEIRSMMTNEGGGTALRVYM